MPIPAPGTYDVASQASLLAVKAKTDLLPANPAAQTLLDAAISSRAAAADYTATRAGKIDLLGISRLAVVNDTSVVNANTTIYVDVQPPAGQEWIVAVVAGGQAGAGGIMGVMMYPWTGATRYGQVVSPSYGGSLSQGCFAIFQITNAVYLRMEFYASAQGGTAQYSYHGIRVV